jgi:hypothetical protein
VACLQCRKLTHLPKESSSERDVIAERVFLDDAPKQPSDRPTQSLDVINTLRETRQVEDAILEDIIAGLECFQSMSKQRNASNLGVRSNPCLIATTAKPGTLELEDFTTNGVQGTLRCPFAKLRDGSPLTDGNRDVPNMASNDVCGHEFDPITAEFNRDKVSDTGSSPRLLVPRCPIRYLDQHSPEEVLQYLENHKHDIPRSHEICVRRFRGDFEKARQIDAKYGGPANMIQGLGEKHKPFLPDRVPDGESPTTSDQRVEEWAKDVGSMTEPVVNVAVEEERPDDPSNRSGYFERPLREIRVGESPGRPWGIPIPISHRDHQNAEVPVSSNSSPGLIESTESNAASSNGVTRLQDSSATSARSVRNGPYAQGAAHTGHHVLETKTPLAKSPHAQGAHQIDGATTTSPEAIGRMLSSPTKMVFNGPVFIGYSAEHAVSLIQKLGGVGTTT